MTKKSMMEEYLNALNDLKKKRGDESLLLWQCGAFFEVYALATIKNGSIEFQEAKYQIETFRDLCNMTVVKKGEQKFQSVEFELEG